MRHNDYPTTLLMEPAANDEPARYRMTPAASTRARKAAWEDPTSAELTRVMDYHHDCYAFERGDHAPSMQWCGVDMAGGPDTSVMVSFRPGDPPMGALDDMVADCTPVSGAALIGTKTEPADTPAPAAQESAKPTFAVGRRVVVLPHPEGGRHPSPFIGLMDADISKSGTVLNITGSGSIIVRLDDGQRLIFPASALRIQA